MSHVSEPWKNAPFTDAGQLSQPEKKAIHTIEAQFLHTYYILEFSRQKWAKLHLQMRLLFWIVYSGPLQFNENFDEKVRQENKIENAPVENKIFSFWKQAKDEMKGLLLSPDFQHLFPRFSLFEAFKTGKKAALNLLRLHK